MNQRAPEDEARFEAIYHEHHRAVLAYCLRRASREDACEAAADVFTVAWRRFGDLPSDEELLRWLYGVAAKVLANQRRGLARFRRLIQKVGGLAPTHAEGPEQQVVRRAQDREIVIALGRLRPKDREALRLCAWEDMPRDEIASLLGTTRSAIDQRIHRAYRRLAAQVKKPRLLGSHAMASRRTGEGGGR